MHSNDFIVRESMMETSSAGSVVATTITTTTTTTLHSPLATSNSNAANTEEQLIASTNDSNESTALNKKLLLCRRFKDSGGIFRNFNSLPLFVYATSPSTHATSADGVGVSREANANNQKNDAFNFAHTRVNSALDDCLPLSGSSGTHSALTMTTAIATTASGSATIPPTAIVVGVGGVSYQHHLNLNHPHHHHLLSSSHTPYSNNYPLQHSSSHHNIHSEQTKSLQELQHEVGALLEFRDLVIETFPDLRHKMASMSSSSSAAIAAVGGSTSVSNTNTLTGGVSNTSLASRREWEPGIRSKRKISQKEPSTSTSTSTASTTTTTGTNSSSGATAAATAGELSSSSLTRSRSNSHSGKKEPKSGENNNGSVVQDSGFSTETSSSKEGHSASSTNGALTGTNALNRLSCPESDDELLNLLDVIHRKSNRLREEMEQLQNYERQNLHAATNVAVVESAAAATSGASEGVTALMKSNSGNSSVNALTPKTFREHVERLNKEDIKQLRKERDRLLDKLAEMEAETLTGRIKAAKMNDQMEELISVKKDLEEQLKLAMAQKLELSARVQQLQQQQQQQQQQSKSSSSQSDYSSQRNFLSSATTVLSTGSGSSHLESTAQLPLRTRQNTFQPVVIEQQPTEEAHFAFHQSAGSDNNKQQHLPLGRLDGVVSTPGARNTKCRMTDSKRFTAILLETSVIELQRHLLTLTVQNQVLMQKLEQSTKSKSHLAKRLDRSSEDVEDLRFQLEEKNIELEGTKAQLRVLESRMHSSTPSSGAATNSYLQHSQNDYETNRSSASTTLMLSRRGPSVGESNNSFMRSTTPPTSQLSNGQMIPPPNVTQISTPSMKAMVHLHMDEIQQHSSSTESAHEHEMTQQQEQQLRLLSTSVGGISPFEDNATRTQQQQQMLRKFGGSSKRSKIPLPGSKAATFFAGKPPSGRASTAGRSPPTVSALSRSTGNLLSKSPNSMKRIDSAQSIRKDNNNSSSSASSFSNNTSRSSTGSSIPMATTSYGGGNAKSYSTTPTPSTRVLQNSPLPKLKRESLTSRVRHLDSLTRVQQQQSNSNSSYEASDASPVNSNIGNGSFLVSSTPKPSAIAAHFNAVLRKDTTLNTSSTTTTQHTHFLRRNINGGTTTTTPNSIAARRFSNAAAAAAANTAAGTRVAASTRNQEQQNANENGIAPINGGVGAVSSDSDSGKVRTLKSTFLGWLKI